MACANRLSDGPLRSDLLRILRLECASVDNGMLRPTAPPVAVLLAALMGERARVVEDTGQRTAPLLLCRERLRADRAHPRRGLQVCARFRAFARTWTLQILENYASINTDKCCVFSNIAYIIRTNHFQSGNRRGSLDQRFERNSCLPGDYERVGQARLQRTVDDARNVGLAAVYTVSERRLRLPRLFKVGREIRERPPLSAFHHVANSMRFRKFCQALRIASYSFPLSRYQTFT